MYRPFVSGMPAILVAESTTDGYMDRALVVLPLSTRFEGDSIRIMWAGGIERPAAYPAQTIQSAFAPNNTIGLMQSDDTFHEQRSRCVNHGPNTVVKDGFTVAVSVHPLER